MLTDLKSEYTPRVFSEQSFIEILYPPSQDFSLQSAYSPYFWSAFCYISQRFVVPDFKL
jgi:hypothetical protein